jgi:hypothetical protein
LGWATLDPHTRTSQAAIEAIANELAGEGLTDGVDWMSQLIEMEEENAPAFTFD